MKTAQFDNLNSEADFCRKEELPKLYASDCTDDSIIEQQTFTDDMVNGIGRKTRRDKAKYFN